MKQDIITRIETTLTPDGNGGYTEETIETGSFAVKLSVSNNEAEATAYGVSVEQILKVIADVPLMEDSLASTLQWVQLELKDLKEILIPREQQNLMT